MFGVRCFYVMGFFSFPMLVYINNGDKNVCNFLTASENCDRKYQEITDLEYVIKTMMNDILI